MSLVYSDNLIEINKTAAGKGYDAKCGLSQKEYDVYVRMGATKCLRVMRGLSIEQAAVILRRALYE